MGNKRGWLAALALLVVLVSACGDDSDTTDAGSGDTGESGGRSVVLKDIAFNPDKITVKVGETVTWSFEDKGIPHNVVADDKSFESETKDDGTFEHTFEKAGTFAYVCTIHPGQMKATVEVT